ncbi:Phosphoglycerate dehydrogenase-like oxidoreductase [Sterolibacterium denitrificans]|uniref:D-3-phosphoglycerate dehydrogenase n=1 Tax=Sterolibacterium denitrificans TaxID=157592 RepID=A0A7Z7HSC6_9PROT|nr:phosphoglycerate dehydrogenase [Sterolibacterium denitrificans]SMB28869.1 Phosphoglycerate dehydrogenase-like oxidoreductase [Sterolibacterium denitrificans]
MATSFQVLILNQISANGLKRLPAERYTSGKSIESPDAVLVRSADMHKMDIPASVRAIGRAGAGTNNIPVKAMSARGVPVFNAPGANANAVKELVIAGMLLAARNLRGAMDFVGKLDPADPEMEKKVEDGKKTYAGYELAGRTLGVVGLGKIGCLVADAALKLGMNVLGFDPEITVDAAWSLSSQVRKAASLNELLKHADFISVHVPLLDATRNMLNADNITHLKHGAVILNFSRDQIVDEQAVLDALDGKKLAAYVCDFPSARINAHPKVIALPHLGASTGEAEENCAIMVAEQLRDYLEHGNIQNAVNFPNVVMPRESNYRVAIANANVPNMVGQISTVMAQAGLNIHNMMNKSRGDMAYTLVDVDSSVPQQTINAIAAIEGVLAVRFLPLED